MNKPPHPGHHEPTEAEIAHEAHRLWLESGQLSGRDLENWNAARELLRHRHGHTVHHPHAPAAPASPRARK